MVHQLSAPAGFSEFDVRVVLDAVALADSTHIHGAGLDSLGATELHSALQTRLGLPLPATLVFDYPTAASIAAFVAERMVPPEQLDVECLPTAGLSAPAGTNSVVCIRNMAVRLPGMELGAGGPADEVDFVDCIASVPPERWDVDLQLTQVPSLPSDECCTNGVH